MDLPHAIRGLARTVALPPAGPHWEKSLSDSLRALREEMSEHVRATEGPAGTYARLLRDAPRLEPGIRALVDDHRAILAALDAPPSAVVDLERWRDWAACLLADVSSHRQRGANLVYEAYLIDIGEPG
ncbi:hypothetical protein [Hamadaea tsunoensis]|uniref:hypothetical protein n=1 Tax=Hamadaea tsunoensis TaxID=53368 RepID=UPI0004265785|nr:hypothetical protein [Hamadaea tsunoensis]